MGNLKVRTIEAAKGRAKPYKLVDGDGLQLRVAPDGCKTWLVRYSVGGTERQYTLPAPYGEAAGCIGLEAARAEARTIRALAASGVDYRSKLADEREAERQAREAMERRLTVRKLFDQWAAVELAKRKDGGAETRRGLEKDVLAALGERAAESITRADVMQVLDGVTARGANRLANRLLAELRQMFGFALVREAVKADPTAGIKKRDVGGTDTERDRTLSEDEIRALPAALAASGLSPRTVHAIWAMLATCCRIGELARARLADIDLERGLWTIPDTKNGKPHTVFLSDFARRHMAALVALSGDGPWLLAAADGKGPACPKSITKQIGDRQRGRQKAKRTSKTASLRLAGGAWVPHDLRRTGATRMGEMRVHDAVIEKCLNHTEPNKVKRTYQRAVREEEQREAWRLLGERLDLLTCTPSNVSLLKIA
jgi:integrase